MRPARSALVCSVVITLVTIAATAFAQIYPPGFNDELVVNGLDVPTCFVVTPDGRMFIGEQSGAIRLFENGLLQPQPMIQLPAETFREQGLVGMTLDPGFPLAPYLYVVYTHATGFHTDNHHWVVRLTVNGDVIDPASEVVLFDQIPTGIGFHVGGCIRFGADGNLLISAGDTNWAPPWPQDLSRLEGKLLRLRPDGSVPPDNPFVGLPGVRPEIYQYGLRNPFRFSIQPGTGAIFIGDVGASAWEEVDVGKPGANFGWPLYEGAAVPADSSVVDPIFQYDHATGSAAIVGNLFYQGNGFPAQYEGNYFFFDHSRGRLGRLVLNPDNSVASADTTWLVTVYSGSGFGPVDLQEGPDGALYYNTFVPGQLRRIFYTGDENRRPSALATADRTNGYAPLVVNFSGAQSFDIDGDSLVYDWNFGDGSPHATTRDASHAFSLEGVFGVRLTVSDGRGGESTSEPITITVGDLAPIVSIDAPVDGSTFLDDQTIEFSGMASDPETGPMPGSELHWRILLHHLNHIHPVILDQTGASGSFVAEFHDDLPATIYYSITAWADDSQGCAASARSPSIRIRTRRPGSRACTRCRPTIAMR
jgi:glucose/arabinose dehydrogenase